MGKVVPKRCQVAQHIAFPRKAAREELCRHQNASSLLWFNSGWRKLSYESFFRHRSANRVEALHLQSITMGENFFLSGHVCSYCQALKTSAFLQAKLTNRIDAFQTSLLLRGYGQSFSHRLLHACRMCANMDIFPELARPMRAAFVDACKAKHPDCIIPSADRMCTKTSAHFVSSCLGLPREDYPLTQIQALGMKQGTHP